MEHAICVYDNPFKRLLFLLISLGFVATGMLLLRDRTFSADPLHVGVAYLCIGFFGLAGIVFLYMLACDVLLRRPVLRVDAQGWTQERMLGLPLKHVAWQDIASIALHRQRVRFSQTMYLILRARHPDQLPPTPVRAINTVLFPPLSSSVMTVPLNPLFLRASPAKVQRLLHDIQAEFASELQGYGIAVAGTIQEM